MRLQQLCAARGLTLDQLAERAGVLGAIAAKLDAGALRANPSVLRRLADVLGLEPGALRYQVSVQPTRRPAYCSGTRKPR